MATETFLSPELESAIADLDVILTSPDPDSSLLVQFIGSSNPSISEYATACYDSFVPDTDGDIAEYRIRDSWSYLLGALIDQVYEAAATIAEANGYTISQEFETITVQNGTTTVMDISYCFDNAVWGAAALVDIY